MDTKHAVHHISQWISDYAQKAGNKNLVVGISGGIDSSVTSVLCGLTGVKTYAISLPIHQNKTQLRLARMQMDHLKRRFPENIQTDEIDLSPLFLSFSESFPSDPIRSKLAEANSKARLRMMTLYHIAALKDALVVGTGNKIEDFGVGFFTKYGDGGVDIAPISDLYKSEIYRLGSFLKVPLEIRQAAPTDGLWEDHRTDYDQLDYHYDDLEKAMKFTRGETTVPPDRSVLKRYKELHQIAQHKIIPIPVCIIPKKHDT